MSTATLPVSSAPSERACPVVSDREWNAHILAQLAAGKITQESRFGATQDRAEVCGQLTELQGFREGRRSPCTGSSACPSRCTPSSGSGCWASRTISASSSASATASCPQVAELSRELTARPYP